MSKRQKENIILLTIENRADSLAMFQVVKKIIDALDGGGALSGDVMLLGGHNIDDDEVLDATSKLRALMDQRHTDQQDDEVVRELPDIIPFPKTLQ